MGETILTPLTQPINGEINIPGDKSISHRAIMLGALAEGKTEVTNFLTGEDCLHTIEAFRALGVSIKQDETRVIIESEGFRHFTEPRQPLYLGNSGTTARLILGILAGLPFLTVIHGDPHLTVRPMARVVNPLREMGAVIDGREQGNYLPIAIRGGALRGMTYELPVKSAQVKSALILAGLFAEGETTIIEKAATRNHTENMLSAFGADLTSKDNHITITNKKPLRATNVLVPGDISSAAFFLVAASIVPNSSLTLKNVGLNETRTGIIDVMLQMGANVTISNKREISGESLGDITVKYAELSGTVIEGELIPRLIDEIPIIALLATQAVGKTIIKDAEELRVKETDRIKAVFETLSTLGARIDETDDGMIIYGHTPLNGGKVKSYSDHRMAMMAVIASLIAEEAVILDDISSIAVSYPNFFNDLRKVVEKK